MVVLLMDLNKEIQNLAKANGIFYCGAADLSLGENGKIKVCGMCLYVCPPGRKNRRFKI